MPYYKVSDVGISSAFGSSALVELESIGRFDGQLPKSKLMICLFSGCYQFPQTHGESGFQCARLVTDTVILENSGVFCRHCKKRNRSVNKKMHRYEVTKVSLK